MINLQHQTLHILISTNYGIEHRKESKALLLDKGSGSHAQRAREHAEVWEKEIPMLRPKTTGNNVRQYTQTDIENVKAVYNLVKVRGFKLSAARKMLRENKQAVDGNARVMESLIKVRDELKLLKKQLDYLE